MLNLNEQPTICSAHPVALNASMSAHPVAECKFYVKDLLPKLIENCDALLPNGYVFQQDGALAHFSRLAQEWISQRCPNFIKKDEWPPKLKQTAAKKNGTFQGHQSFRKNQSHSVHIELINSIFSNFLQKCYNFFICQYFKAKFGSQTSNYLSYEL